MHLSLGKTNSAESCWDASMLRERWDTMREDKKTICRNYSGFNILFIVWMLSQPRGQNMYIFRGMKKKVFNISNLYPFSLVGKKRRVLKRWKHAMTFSEHANTRISFRGQFCNFQFVENFTEIFHFLSREIRLRYEFCMLFPHFIRESREYCCQHSHRFRFPFHIVGDFGDDKSADCESSTHAQFSFTWLSTFHMLSTHHSLSLFVCDDIFKSRKFIQWVAIELRAPKLAKERTFARVANLYDSNSDLMSPEKKIFSSSSLFCFLWNMQKLLMLLKWLSIAGTWTSEPHTDSLSTSAASLTRSHSFRIHSTFQLHAHFEWLNQVENRARECVGEREESMILQLWVRSAPELHFITTSKAAQIAMRIGLRLIIALAQLI